MKLPGGFGPPDPVGAQKRADDVWAATHPAQNVLQMKPGTNWVRGQSGPAIDPTTGEQYLVNPMTGTTTPYGQRQYGLPSGPMDQATLQQYMYESQYGQYGYGMDPYSQYGGYNPYGYSQWAPQSWFDGGYGGGDPTYGGGGFQNDGTWVDPRAVAAFYGDDGGYF